MSALGGRLADADRRRSSTPTSSSRSARRPSPIARANVDDRGDPTRYQRVGLVPVVMQYQATLALRRGPTSSAEDGPAIPPTAPMRPHRPGRPALVRRQAPRGGPHSVVVRPRAREGQRRRRRANADDRSTRSLSGRLPPAVAAYLLWADRVPIAFLNAPLFGWAPWRSGLRRWPRRRALVSRSGLGFISGATGAARSRSSRITS